MVVGRGKFTFKKNIKSNIIKLVVLYFIVFLFSFSGLYFERFFNLPYKFLFISPSIYNNTDFNWTTSVWGSVLGIHGTIAALSITFMSMFVGQVSSYSEYGFESISKILILRDNKFLDFSMESICSLICGVLLLTIGCGFIGYFLSLYFSLLFIIKYGVMYYKLYEFMEKSDTIRILLFNNIKSVGSAYSLVNTERKELNKRFHEKLSSSDYIQSELIGGYFSSNVVELDVFPMNANYSLVGFNDKVLSEFYEMIEELGKSNNLVLLLNVDFFSPLIKPVAKIVTSSDKSVDNSLVLKITELLKGALVVGKLPPIYESFKAYEEALLVNLRKHLMKGDEWALDFGVKVFYELTTTDNYSFTLRNFDLSIVELKNKKIFNISVFSSFYEKMISYPLRSGELVKAAGIMSSLINLSRYIYSKEDFAAFYKSTFRNLENRVRYGIGDSEYVFLDLLIDNTISNLVNMNYTAFECDTELVTYKMRFLEKSNKIDHEYLNGIQKKILRCVFEVVTLLILRIQHIIKKNEIENNEFIFLRKLLKSWMNARFLEELYYKEETYFLLFSIPKDYRSFGAEWKLREIPDGEATMLSIADDSYKMIAMFLIHSDFSNNHFDSIFIRDYARFKSYTDLNTHQIKSIISILEDEPFHKTYEAITGEILDNKKIKPVVDKLNSLLLKFNEIILKEVIESDLNTDLVDQYVVETKSEIEKLLKSILNLDDIPKAQRIIGSTFMSLINKRELLTPIDGVHYSQNVHNLSFNLVYDWLRSLLPYFQNGHFEILELESYNEIENKGAFCIEYKVSDRINTFRYTKGLKMTDDSGVLGFERPGIYYFMLSDCFTMERSSDLLSLNVDSINEKNLDLVSSNFNIKNENPFLYALMDTTFNIDIIPKEKFDIYFLSEERCKFLNDRQDQEIEQLFKSDKKININESF